MAGPRGAFGPRGFLTEEEKKEMPKVTKELLLRILSYLKPYWFQFVLVFAAILLSSAVGLLPSIITGRIVDQALVGKNPHEQAHIDYAKNALKLVEEYNAHLDGPANEKEREEMMSAYELRELQQRKEAYNPKPKEKSIEEQLKEHEEYQMKMGM